MEDNFKENAVNSFIKLLEIMEDLRAKCPWDKKQTLESLRSLTIEETFELSDAILEGDLKNLKEELGDLLLHVVFYSKIASETKDFDIVGVIDTLCEKLIRRHPHIYGNVNAEDEEAVKRNWEQIKQEEKKNSKEKKGVLSGVPQSLPALIKASRIQEKARSVGFDWDNKGQVWEKIKEELLEFELETEKENNQTKIENEFGDILFAMVNFARFVEVNPENALEATNKKFIKRFNFIESTANQTGRNIAEMNIEEMEALWQKAKAFDNH